MLWRNTLECFRNFYAVKFSDFMGIKKILEIEVYTSGKISSYAGRMRFTTLYDGLDNTRAHLTNSGMLIWFPFLSKVVT